jgi:ABC-type transport system involved in multi-copper enzyme maturation permease subunit
MTAIQLAPEELTTSRFGDTLSRVVASEATKLRSVRSTVWTLLVAAAATVGIGAVFCLAEVARWNRLSLHARAAFDPTLQSLNGIVFAQLAIGVLGVLMISSEYGTGLIRTTLSAVPRRGIVLGSKTIVFAAVVFGVALTSCFAAFGVGQAILTGKGIGVSLGDPGTLRAVAGAGVYLTAIGLIGLALGTLLRRTAAAIAALVGIVLVLPTLTHALPSPWGTDVTKYLPSQAGQAIFSVRHTSDLLHPWAGAAVLVGYVAAALITAAFVFIHRDS